MNQRRQPAAPRVCRCCSHVQEQPGTEVNTAGSAPGIKPSVEVKATPVRHPPPEEQPEAAKKREGKDKDPGKQRGRRALKNVTFFHHLVGGVNQI